MIVGQQTNPRLDLIVGPNGSGKSTLARMIRADNPNLPFVNADEIAQLQYPDDPEGAAYAAAREADVLRNALIDRGMSFMAETVFSHPSKLAVLSRAAQADFRVVLHVVMITEDMAVERVNYRISTGGHSVPEEKIRSRYNRLWSLVSVAIALSETAYLYDNSGSYMKPTAQFCEGVLSTCSYVPEWIPHPLADLLRSAPTG